MALSPSAPVDSSRLVIQADACWSLGKGLVPDDVGGSARALGPNLSREGAMPSGGGTLVNNDGRSVLDGVTANGGAGANCSTLTNGRVGVNDTVSTRGCTTGNSGVLTSGGAAAGGSALTSSGVAAGDSALTSGGVSSEGGRFSLHKQWTWQC
jgi:hypothetical protein